MGFQKIKGVPNADGSTCNGAQPCPGIWAEEGDTENLLVQGYVVNSQDATEIGVPEGELIVRVPRKLIVGGV